MNSSSSGTLIRRSQHHPLNQSRTPSHSESFGQPPKIPNPNSNPTNTSFNDILIQTSFISKANPLHSPLPPPPPPHSQPHHKTTGSVHHNNRSLLSSFLHDTSDELSLDPRPLLDNNIYTNKNGNCNDNNSNSNIDDDLSVDSLSEFLPDISMTSFQPHTHNQNHTRKMHALKQVLKNYEAQTAQLLHHAFLTWVSSNESLKFQINCGGKIMTLLIQKRTLHSLTFAFNRWMNKMRRYRFAHMGNSIYEKRNKILLLRVWKRGLYINWIKSSFIAWRRTIAKEIKQGE